MRAPRRRYQLPMFFLIIALILPFVGFEHTTKQAIRKKS